LKVFYIVFGLACLSGSLASAACDPARVDLRGDFGQLRFSVEVADDPQERSRGLMFVTDMGRMEGMLFVYERPNSPVFWMKNTPQPLDIIFFDPEGRVTTIQADAKPFDETGLPGGENVQYVLEIHAGLAERFGIAEGTELRHPALGPEAAWPCD
jgi:uncharacterized membrane protein (UPF0127 family)